MKIEDYAAPPAVVPFPPRRAVVMPSEPPVARNGLMAGKRGLVMGVANDHSIAWGIAKTLAAQGATLAFTYQGEALGKRVKPLAESVGSNLVRRATSRTSPRSTKCSQALGGEWGALDFLVHAIAFSDKNELKGRYADTTRENFIAHHADLVLLLHRDRPARGRPDAARRLDGDADLWRLDARDAELQRHGRRQGRAGSLRALSRRRFRPAGIRVNAISAGPVRTLAGAGISDARLMFNYPAAARAAAPHRRASRRSAARRSISCPTCPPASPATSISSIPATTSFRCRIPPRSRRSTKPRPPPSRRPPPKTRRSRAARGSEHEIINTSYAGLTRVSMQNVRPCGGPAWIAGSSPAMTRATREDRSAEIRQGRSGRRSSPCSRPPRSHARTSAARRRSHRLRQGRAAGRSNRK